VRISSAGWTWMRRLGGAAVAGALVWRVGTGPFLEGVRRVDGLSLGAATAIAGMTTVCCAWRWSLVARGLGLEVPLRAAIPAYYRSQFLNLTLPGGVVGDVHRAASQGRRAGDLLGSARAVLWERVAGQAVLLLLTVGALLTLPLSRPLSACLAGALGVTAAVGTLLGGRHLLRRHREATHGGGRQYTPATPFEAAPPTRSAWRIFPAVVLASGLVTLGHAATFLIAARTTGSTASPLMLLPIALVVQVASAIPVNLAGWGPREGAAAWVFGAAGLGAAQGLGASVAYGVLALVATLPGAVLLLASVRRRGAGAAPLRHAEAADGAGRDRPPAAVRPRR
jgi:uncharacterized membrane protein YbhN (UPF0104 family)